MSANHINTRELAHLLRVQEQTIRNAYCRDGHYLNLRPTKLPNRLLLWPAEQAQALASGNFPSATAASAAR